MPELTVLVPIGDRQIEMRKATDGSLVVLSRTFRGLSKIENVEDITDEMRESLVRKLGILGQVIEGMIVKASDQDWLDDALISGKVSAEDVFGLIKVASEKLNGQTAPAQATKAVRRRTPGR